MTPATLERPRTRSRRACVGGRLYTPAGMGREQPRKPRGQRSTKLGRDLTAARLLAGLTQEQLAERLGASVSTVRAWESGANAPRGIHRKAIERFLARHAPADGPR